MSEKKANLEKFKTFSRDIDSHSDLVKKINDKLGEDSSLKSDEILNTLKRYDDIKRTVDDTITVSIIVILVNTYNVIYIVCQIDFRYLYFFRNLRDMLMHTYNIRNHSISFMIGYVTAKSKFNSVLIPMATKKKSKRNSIRLTLSYNRCHKESNC